MNEMTQNIAKSNGPLRVLISGGGTGGHIFPAVSIANALKRRCPEAEILFVGAEGRMEMEKVPAAGYDIVGLPVAGFDRKRLWRNAGVLIKLMRSMRKARKVLKKFNPDIAVGVGGYASGPMLKQAQKNNIPTLLQEQNSYAGVTNKLLAAKARAICVAYEGMERFFPAESIELTGNPVRSNLLNCILTPAQANESMPAGQGKSIVLILGGKDKGNDYSEIEPLVREKVKTIVCMGKDNTKLLDFFGGKVDEIIDTHSLAEAVEACRNAASAGDTVLLSPCCASFDLFKSYEQRGDLFKEAVKALQK